MASSGDKLTYFLVGGFVGASVALLLAPRSGEETRDMLGDRYREGSDKIGETFRSGREVAVERSREFADRAGETIGRGRETLSQQKDQLAAAVEAGRQAYEEERQQLQDTGKAEVSPSGGGSETQQAKVEPKQAAKAEAQKATKKEAKSKSTS